MEQPSVFFKHTPALNRSVLLRHNTSDENVWGDTFNKGYHFPLGMIEVPKTVLDLGSNIGLTAAHYRALWPEAHIVAVEMDGDNYHLGLKNAPGVKHLWTAVSETGGRGAYRGGDRQSYRFVPGALEGVFSSSKTLRQIIRENTPEQKVDFVKMDIEGMEWKVFEQSSWVPLVRYLLVELHSDDGSWPVPELVEPAIEILRELGFLAEPHQAHPCAVWAWKR